MPEEVTGQIEKMQDEQAANGNEYTIITLKGQKKVFFDWKGCCKAAGISTGDTVKIDHEGGQFQRVADLRRL